MLRPTTGLRLILSPDRIRRRFPRHIPTPSGQSSESFQEQCEAAGKFRATKITDAPCPLFWPHQFNTTHTHVSSHSQIHQVESLFAIIAHQVHLAYLAELPFSAPPNQPNTKCPVSLPILSRRRQARPFWFRWFYRPIRGVTIWSSNPRQYLHTLVRPGFIAYQTNPEFAIRDSPIG